LSLYYSVASSLYLQGTGGGGGTAAMDARRSKEDEEISKAVEMSIKTSNLDPYASAR